MAWSRPHGLIERPGQYPSEAEAWVYCDKFSYFEGETVSIKTHTTAATYDIEIIRDGHKPRIVLEKKGLKGQQCATPHDAYAAGCNWPEALALHLEVGEWESAFYLVLIRIKDTIGRVFEREGFFIVKAKEKSKNNHPYTAIPKEDAKN